MKEKITFYYVSDNNKKINIGTFPKDYENILNFYFKINYEKEIKK